VDRDAIERATKKLEKAGADFALVMENFRNLDKALEKLATDGKIKNPSADRILFDLGWSSNQFELSGRGFSFMRDEPLVMTLSAEPALITAHDIVNGWEEEVIADVLYGYGEEQFSRRIARGIVKAREKGEIKTTGELVTIIEKAVPAFYRNKKTHPATKTFQALRIAVNDELGALREGLEKAWLALNPGGRLAVITFHSIEDRIVKRMLREKASADLGKLVTKKPSIPSKEELKANPRSRSAKLRIIQKHITKPS